MTRAKLLLDGDAAQDRANVVPFPEEMVGFILPDRNGIGRSVASYAAKQVGYDDPPTYTPAEPDDSLKVWPPPRPFAPPREVARLTEARPKGRGWKNGFCPTATNASCRFGGAVTVTAR